MPAARSDLRFLSTPRRPRSKTSVALGVSLRTSRVLKPAEEVTCSFALCFTNCYEGVRTLLYQNGGVDIQGRNRHGRAVRDLTAMLALRTAWKIEKIAPEFLADTTVEYVGEHGANTRVYSDFPILDEVHFGASYADVMGKVAPPVGDK